MMEGLVDKLVRRMAVKGGISVSEAERVAAEITRILAEGVLAGDEVKLNGFGRLRVKERLGPAWDPVKKKRVERKRRRVVEWKAAKTKG